MHINCLLSHYDIKVSRVQQHHQCLNSLTTAQQSEDVWVRECAISYTLPNFLTNDLAQKLS